MSAFRYDFTLIMAVYQVEEFLAEAVDSVIAQDYPFERVQIILVDDGSTDRSGAIADEYAARYPNNIIALHKENGGQASARNLGLTRCEGELINFMDPDDTLTPETLGLVKAFFEGHGEETDIVSIPMFHFGAITGPHWQNTKFNKGTRVIDLIGEYKVQQASSSSAFFHSRVKPLMHFDERLPNCEDLRMNLSVLLRKPTLGVVNGCKYMYRKRPSGGSTVDGLMSRKSWYFDSYTYLSEAVCGEAVSLYGYVPYYVQYAILCDLQWRFRSNYEAQMAQVLTEEERQAYLCRTGEVLRLFDVECIMALPGVNAACRGLMLRMKYGRQPDRLPVGKDVVLHYGNTVLSRLSWSYTKLHFLTETEAGLKLEGTVNLPGLEDHETPEILLDASGNLVPCRVTERSGDDQLRLGFRLQRVFDFTGALDVAALPDEAEVGVVLRLGGREIRISSLECGRFMPLSHWVHGSSCRMAGRRLTMRKDALLLDKRTGRADRLKDELRLLKTLAGGKSEGMRKAFAVRMAAHLMKPFQRKKVWLFSDRVMRAGDNGEALFRYVTANCPKGVKPVFILHSQSPDFARMKTVGRVVAYDSVWGKLYYLLAAVSVSSSGDQEARNPFDWRVAYYADMMKDLRYVFLQHGITKDDQTKWLNRMNKAIDGLVCSSRREWEAFRDPGYGYPDENLWLTGMPRFDLLEEGERKVITVMPTWRQSLMINYDPEKGQWNLNPESFMQSDYYQFYQGLLTDERLLAACKKHGVTLQFYPHPNVLQHIGLFHPDPSVVVPDESKPYREVYAESGLVVTDYSSAVFDFAYLRRPVLYAQFDREAFFSGTHVYKAGYFDYERDGFGPVTADLDSTVDAIISQLERGFVLEPRYRQRIDSFFAFNDRESCRRVLEKIMALPGVLPERS